MGVEFPEDPVPKDGKSPKTGDTNRILLYMALILAGVSALVVSIRRFLPAFPESAAFPIFPAVAHSSPQ